jgi:hypothetical protein
MALAGGLLAIVEPLDVRNAGFVLTFGATAALLHVVRRERWGPPNRVAVDVDRVIRSGRTRASAGDGRNIFARECGGPRAERRRGSRDGVVQIAGLVVVMASHFDTIGSIAGWSAHLGSTAIVGSARLVDVAPWLAFRVPARSGVVVVYYVGLAGLSRLDARRSGGQRVRACCCGADDHQRLSLLGRHHGLRLTMLDVGQGEAIALQVAGGRTMMIDAGGAPFGGGASTSGRASSSRRCGDAVCHSLVRCCSRTAIPTTSAARCRSSRTSVRLQCGRASRAARAVVAAGAARAKAAGIPIEERRAGEQFSIGAARVFVLHPQRPIGSVNGFAMTTRWCWRSFTAMLRCC